MERKKKRINELENRTIESTQFEQWRENRLQKKKKETTTMTTQGPVGLYQKSEISDTVTLERKEKRCMDKKYLKK